MNPRGLLRVAEKRLRELACAEDDGRDPFECACIAEEISLAVKMIERCESDDEDILASVRAIKEELE